MGYNFTAEWIKGALNNGPDALSRNPTSEPRSEELLAEQDLDNLQAVSTGEIRAITGKQHENPRLQDLRKAAESDQEYRKLKHYVYNGFPKNCQNLPDECRRYWHIRAHFSIEDDLIIIPTKMRREVLAQLHDSHQGTVRTKERTRLSVYWPGIDNDIDNVILIVQELPRHTTI